MKRSVIRSTGRFVPDRHVSNDDLAGILDTSDEWIRQRTGIEARYWVGEGADVGTSDLALEASAKNVPALDIRQQCTGFLHGLELCDAYIRSGKAQKILMVGAETQSRFLQLTTRNRDTAVIFADGAGAACIEARETNEETGILASVFHADGRYADVLRVGVPARKSGPVMNAEVLARQEYFPYMDGGTVFKLAVTLLPKVARELLEKAGIQPEALDMVVPHQANLRINEAFRDRMNIPEEKVYNNIQQYGNTTAATIPIALDELIEKEILKSGHNVMLIGLGAGLTWGGVMYRLP